MPSHPAAGPPASPRQVVLGLFICWQLIFIVVANLLTFFTWFSSEHADEDMAAFINRLAPGFADKKGHGWEWCAILENKVMLPWSQLLRQDKNWSLFAPDVHRGFAFPGLLLIEDAAADDRPPAGWVPTYDSVNGHHLLAAPTSAAAGGSDLFLADTEPADIHAYLRIGNHRVERYEEELYINPMPWVSPTTGRTEKPDDTARRVSRRVAERLQDYRGLVIAYTKWRLSCWQAAHPDRPVPKQVILFERFYRIHGPDEAHGWDGPFLVPLARWQPAAGQEYAHIVLEAYDFTKNRFSPVK